MMTFVLLLASLLLQDPIEEARALVEEGRSLEALQKLEAASREQPENAAIQHALAALYTAAGRGPEALTHIRKAVELAPDDKSYALAYGELLYRGGRFEDAKPMLEKAAELPDALVLLAAVYEKLGPKEEMFSTLARYLEMRPEDKGVRLLLGQQLEAAKRYDEALEVYRDGPDDPVLHYHAADVMSRSRETYAESESYARKALEASPEMLEARLLLARLLDRTERYDEALRELERAREDHAEASQVYYNLATAFRRAGRLEEARSAAERFQELSAKEKEASDREARVAVTYKKAADLLAHGNMRDAEPAFAAVLEIDPDHAQTRSMLAKIAFSKGDFVSAQRWIAEAIEKDASVGEFHYLQALFSMRAGDIAAAVPAVERSLELDAAFPDAWSLLGSIMLDSGEAARAVECFLNAAALEPENATTQLNLASAYAGLGKTAEEEAAMERYRSLSKR